jgi:hypothetical protein
MGQEPMMKAISFKIKINDEDVHMYN